MNVLDTVGIRLPCQSCGGTYQVPLRDVLLSHTMLHEGCPARQETECPPVFQSRLFERRDIEELQRTWNQLEQRARADGGELVFMAAGASDETQPTGRGKALPSSGRPSESSVPTTLASRRAQERIGKQSERTQKAKIHKQTHTKAKTGKNRRIA
jgi:hypothetical protein